MSDAFEHAKYLADVVFDRAMGKTGDMIELTQLDRVEETIVLVYHVLGLAGGMGLKEMLDDEMNADPGYVLTIRAFREIGANEMAEILEEGITRKTSIALGMDASGMREFDTLDEDFYARERDCVMQMGRYVAANTLG
jgi:hypothetical protein